MQTIARGDGLSERAGRIDRHPRRIPGDPGIWVFILLDMLIFAEMFIILAWYRTEHHEVFEAAQRLVIPGYGLTYTVLLLTSSWCVVMAVTAARKGSVKLSSDFATWGLALGAAFVVIKLVEYSTKLAAGITPATNEFFMFFFVMTLVHLLHASAGLGVLTYMRRKIRGLEAVSPAPDAIRMIETSAVYWHMVDLLWIVLFALFYLES